MLGMCQLIAMVVDRPARFGFFPAPVAVTVGPRLSENHLPNSTAVKVWLMCPNQLSP